MSAEEDLRKLVVGLRLDVEGGNALMDFDKKFQSVVKSVTDSTFYHAIVSVGRALTDMSLDLGEQSVVLDRTAQSLHTTTQELQRLEYAAKASNIDAPFQSVVGVLERIKGLRVSAGTSPGGGTAGGLLAYLGVRPGMSPGQQIQAIADRLPKLKGPIKDLAISMAGLEPILPLLRKGGDELKRLMEQADATGNVLGDKTVEDGKKLSEQLALLEADFAGAKNQLAVEVLPVAKDFLVVLRSWIPALVEIGKGLLNDLGINAEAGGNQVEVLRSMLEAAKLEAQNLKGTVDDLAETLRTLKKVLELVGEALLIRFAVAKAAAGMTSLGAATTTATALLALYRNGWITVGGVAGAALTSIKVAVNSVNGAMIVLLANLEIWKQVWSEVKALDDYTKGENSFTDYLVEAWSEVLEYLNQAVTAFKTVANLTTNWAGFHLFADDSDRIQEQIDAIDQKLGQDGLSESRRGQLQNQRRVLAVELEQKQPPAGNFGPMTRFVEGSAAPMPEWNSSSQSVNVGDTTIQVSVEGAPSPEATARATAAVVGAQMDERNRQAYAKTAPTRQR